MAKMSGLPSKVQLENESPTMGTLGGSTGMRFGSPVEGLTPADKVKAGPASPAAGTSPATGPKSQNNSTFGKFQFRDRPYFNMNSDGGRERAEQWDRQERSRFSDYQFRKARLEAMTPEEREKAKQRRSLWSGSRG